MDKAARKQASAAATWRRNEGMEQLAEIRASRPDRYDLVSPGQKISLAHYLRAKAAAEAEGLDTGGDA